MLTLIVLLALMHLAFTLAWFGILGDRARHYVTELNEAGRRQRVEQQLREADRASAKAHQQARSAMNEAVGQQWRNLSEWRDD